MHRTEAYIIDAVRTPMGRKKGSLAHVHGADLGAHVIKTLVERNKVEDDAYDDVIFGCVDTIGPLAGDIARTSWLAAGLSEAVPGTTVDRQCGSSQQAVHFAAQAIMSGTMDVVLAGGVQTMSQIPIAAAMLAGQAYGFPDPFSGSQGFTQRYGKEPPSQFYAAQKIAEKWGLSRRDLEEFALGSHQKAIAAIETGQFSREVVESFGLKQDETPRFTSLEKMAELEPVQGLSLVTPGVASQITDGAAALLLASEKAVARWDLKPMARIHHMSVRADDPIMMLTAPISASKYAMHKAGMKASDMDLIEVNEAFASVALAFLHDTGFDAAKTNINGGAIALGHPLGATGARLLTTMVHALAKRGGRYGLVTMCEGGGQANVTVVECLEYENSMNERGVGQ